MVGFEVGIVGGNFDRGEVRVNRDLACRRVKRDDRRLGEDFAGGCGWRGRRILGHDGLFAVIYCLENGMVNSAPGSTVAVRTHRAKEGTELGIHGFPFLCFQYLCEWLSVMGSVLKQKDVEIGRTSCKSCAVYIRLTPTEEQTQDLSGRYAGVDSHERYCSGMWYASTMPHSCFLLQNKLDFVANKRLSSRPWH